MKEYEQTGNTVHRPGENVRNAIRAREQESSEWRGAASRRHQHQPSSPPLESKLPRNAPKSPSHPRTQFLHVGGQYTHEVDDVYRYQTRRRHLLDVTAVRATYITHLF
jgi:hypothetical protein